MQMKMEAEPMAQNMKKQGSLTRFFGSLGVLVAVLFSAAAGTTLAQQATGNVPQVEVSGGYSYVRANPANSNGGFNLNGGSGSLTYNFTDHFSAVGEFGGYHFSGLPAGLSSTMYTYLFGPRISLRKSGRVTPFAQVLLGGGRLNASSGGVDAGENGFAMAVGGGVDLNVNSRFAIRLVQADYLLTRFANVNGSSVTQNNARISAGLVFRFGSR